MVNLADTQNFYLPFEKQIYEHLKTIDHLKKQNQDTPLFTTEIRKLEQKLDKLKEQVYGKLNSWERVLICRHPSRPHTINYVQHITDKFIEFHGDRTHGDDPAVIGGFARIGPMECVLIGQEKGDTTETRLKRNFGMVNPEGFRKALRLMELAEKCSLPIVTLLDTPGANARLEAEERGQGWAIAENLFKMARIETPIIVLIIGEGCSGGALGMGVGDSVAMLEHAYYSVISPEGCASILWKDAGKKQEAAQSLKLNSEDLLELNIIDEIIKEPLGGAHHDPDSVYAAVKQFIIDKWEILRMIPSDLLLEQRYMKLRRMGRFRDS